MYKCHISSSQLPAPAQARKQTNSQFPSLGAYTLCTLIKVHTWVISMNNR